MTQELSLEQWSTALESYSEVVDTISNIGLVADPREPLTKPAQDLIQNAVDAVSQKAGMEDKAIVIAAESFNLDGIKNFLKTITAKLIGFIKQIIKYIGDFIRKADEKLGDAIDTVNSWTDEVWKRIDEFMGKKPKDSEEDNSSSFIKLSFAVGAEPIKTYSDLSGSLRHYVDDAIPFLFKLLDRDSTLINELLISTAYFGKLDIQHGSSTLTKACKEADSKIQTTQFKANQNILGGLVLEEVSRPDNLGVVDNPVFDTLKQIKAIVVTSHDHPKIDFDKPTQDQLKDIARLAGKLKKSFKDKKDKFSSYSEDILKEAKKLEDALKSLENTTIDNDQDTASIMLGQKTVATVMWLTAHYMKEGSAIFRTYRDVGAELTRLLEALVSVSEKSKSEESKQ